MSRYLESIVGIVAGLIIGLPQSLGELPMEIPSEMPPQTVLIILVFGIAGGLAFGINFLTKKNEKDLSYGAYFFFLTGVLSISVPLLIKDWNGNLIQSFNIASLFFGAVGLGMLSVGSLKLMAYAYKNT